MTTPHEAALKVPQAGEAAPKFSGPVYPEGNIALDDFAGKKNVILAFYPKDMTPGCTKEMCDFSTSLPQFDDADTQVIGVSCDSVDSHRKFAEQFDLNQLLLSDETGEISRSFGAIREGARMANRLLFVIDKQGVIRHVVEGMPNNAELLTVVRALK